MFVARVGQSHVMYIGNFKFDYDDKQMSFINYHITLITINLLVYDSKFYRKL